MSVDTFCDKEHKHVNSNGYVVTLKETHYTKIYDPIESIEKLQTLRFNIGHIKIVCNLEEVVPLRIIYERIAFILYAWHKACIIHSQSFLPYNYIQYTN